MGTDNLHHKRKAKKDNDLERRRAKRATYDYVLIVCEGSKTEPHYLRELIQYYRLNSANVEICGDSGSSPISVVEYAIAKQAQATKAQNPYDRVFCVFDKDSHSTYQTARNEAKANNLKDVVSIPCFEFWLLLHFTYTTQFYSATGYKSICGAVIHDLKQHLPNYEKSQQDLFITLFNQLDDAIKRAKSVNATAERNQTDNPSTYFYELVEYLRNLKTP